MKLPGIIALCAAAITAGTALADDERVITCLVEVHDDGVVQCFDDELKVTVVLENGPQFVEEGLIEDGDLGTVGYNLSTVGGGKGKGHLIDTEEVAFRS